MTSCGVGIRTPVPMVPGQNYMRTCRCIRQQGRSIRSKGRQENGLLLKCVRSNPKTQSSCLSLGDDWVLLWIETSQAQKNPDATAHLTIASSRGLVQLIVTSSCFIPLPSTENLLEVHSYTNLCMLKRDLLHYPCSQIINRGHTFNNQEGFF